MVGSIYNFGGYNERQVKQNPDDYAKLYAEQNGLSIEDAKAELKTQYGDPMQNASGSIFNFNADSNINDMDFSDIYGAQELQVASNEQNGISSLFQQFLNFLNGNNKTNQNNFINNEVEVQHPNFLQNQMEQQTGIHGQHRVGIPKSYSEQNREGNGPQMKGDPQPHLGGNWGMNGPQNEGDPQPHLGGNGENPFQQQNPDVPSTTEIPQQPSAPEKQSEPQKPEAPQQPSAPKKPSEPQKPERPERPDLGSNVTQKENLLFKF